MVLKEEQPKQKRNRLAKRANKRGRNEGKNSGALCGPRYGCRAQAIEVEESEKQISCLYLQNSTRFSLRFFS